LRERRERLPSGRERFLNGRERFLNGRERFLNGRERFLSVGHASQRGGVGSQMPRYKRRNPEIRDSWRRATCLNMAITAARAGQHGPDEPAGPSAGWLARDIVPAETPQLMPPLLGS
jgi:hypothetical protein